MNVANWLLRVVTLFMASIAAQASPIGPFISEIHYDNIGADSDELVAVSAPSGFDWAGWQVLFYNGANGTPYASVDLIDPMAPGGAWAESAVRYTGIQNGPDGVALVSPGGIVAEFLAYEGVFSGSQGPASGLVARQLPLSENGVAVGLSLQRRGLPADFDWELATATPGQINAGLVLAGPALPADPVTVDVPAVWLLCLAGLMVLAIRSRGKGFRMTAYRVAGS